MSLFAEEKGINKKSRIALLRNRGDYLHNVKTIQYGRGSVVVRRKSNQSNIQINNFVTCPNCHGLFIKRNLSRHNCPRGGGGDLRRQVKGKSLSREASFLMPIPGISEEENTDPLRQVINGMRSDHIVTLLRNDWLIQKYAIAEVKKNGFDPDRHNGIREKLRQIGRLLDVLRQQQQIEERGGAGATTSQGLEKFINPSYFKDIIKATQVICKGRPSLALKLGNRLNACASLLLATALETGDAVLRRRCEDYLTLHALKWREEVSSGALRALYQNKARKPDNLPLSADILKLSKYLTDQLHKCTVILKGDGAEEGGDIINFKLSAWIRMAKLLLVRIILFNRKRQGEVSKMKIGDILLSQQTKHHRSSQQDDVIVEKSLDDIEKQMLEKYSLVHIVGKRGRIVPVLLDKEMSTAIEDYLIKYRQESLKDFILPENDFLFACQYSQQGHLRGSDCLREIVNEADLSNPELVTSTKLRKQVATMTQVVNLPNNELDVVAQFMGHDINVHREFYRLPSSTLHLAKVSKLLNAVERGNMDIMASPSNDTRDTDTDTIALEKQAEQAESPPPPPPSSSSSSSSSPPPPPIINDIIDHSYGHGDGKDSHSHNNMTIESSTISVNNKGNVNVPPQRDYSGRKKWSQEEKDACIKQFHKHFIDKTIPSKTEICRLNLDRKLSHRTWAQIRNFIRNQHEKQANVT